MILADSHIRDHDVMLKLVGNDDMNMIIAAIVPLRRRTILAGTPLAPYIALEQTKHVDCSVENTTSSGRLNPIVQYSLFCHSFRCLGGDVEYVLMSKSNHLTDLQFRLTAKASVGFFFIGCKTEHMPRHVPLVRGLSR